MLPRAGLRNGSGLDPDVQLPKLLGECPAVLSSFAHICFEEFHLGFELVTGLGLGTSSLAQSGALFEQLSHLCFQLLRRQATVGDGGQDAIRWTDRRGE